MIESIIGCKWSLSVIEALSNGICRPGEMQRAIPDISAKVLNERLQKLLKFGVIHKKIFPETPLHVEYTFSEFGKKFKRLIGEIESLQEELEDYRR
ncbi:MAG: winged helix-turn-helix transcriptional regulator [Thermodesulfobacteriota bacterium]